MGMFCYQCEQAGKGPGCTAFGNCGKDPETAALQDLLVHAAKGIAMCAHRARELGRSNHEIDIFVADALFTTVTNVNFDPQNIESILHKSAVILAEAKTLYESAADSNKKATETLRGPALWEPASSLDGLISQGETVSIEQRRKHLGEDVTSLQELLVYGLKGTAAYSVHARCLGKEDPSVYAFFHEALSYIAQPSQNIEVLLRLCLHCGEVNLQVMEMLDSAHTETFGHPIPTQVRVTPKKGKAILVSGHDLKDLHELLKQTEGTGINVYTHGEMLPAHGYPQLHRFSHLAGNYGGAWQDQRKEFDEFPGAILMTTNCIQKPKDTYKARIFSGGLVAWPGVEHIDGDDFSRVIEAAHTAPGFLEDSEEKLITVGFGHNTVLGVADKIVDAVKSGALKHFFLIGGCDGAKPGRNYYTEFAHAVPQDCAILTLACGKYRFNKDDFGTIGDLPRLLDIGQCNDAYSAIKIASALAEAFDCEVNDLPLSMIISWYEQKAVCILLTLLSLGIKNIRLGPSLPAFLSPAVTKVLVENYNLMPIDTAEKDLAACLKHAA